MKNFFNLFRRKEIPVPHPDALKRIVLIEKRYLLDTEKLGFFPYGYGETSTLNFAMPQVDRTIQLFNRLTVGSQIKLIGEVYEVTSVKKEFIKIGQTQEIVFVIETNPKWRL